MSPTRVHAPINHFTENTRRSRCRNQYTETLPRAQLDALHLKKLQLLLNCAYEHSAFYRRVYDAAGFKPEDVNSLDEFKRKVPVTDKKDFIHTQQCEQFGKPIVEFQSVQLKLAEMAMKVEASRLLIQRAAQNAAYGYPEEFPMEQRLRDAWGWGIAGGTIDIQ